MAEERDEEFAASPADHQARIAASRAEHGALFDDLLAAVNSEHLIPPWFNETWADEDYLAGEVAIMLEQLPVARSADDVLGILHDAFVRGFGPVADESLPEQYERVADRIWRRWQARGGIV